MLQPPTPRPAPQETLVRGQRRVTEELYAGTYASASYAPFSQTVPESKVGLDTFKYISSLVSACGRSVAGGWKGWRGAGRWEGTA